MPFSLSIVHINECPRPFVNVEHSSDIHRGRSGALFVRSIWTTVPPSCAAHSRELIDLLPAATALPLAIPSARERLGFLIFEAHVARKGPVHTLRPDA